MPRHDDDFDDDRPRRSRRPRDDFDDDRPPPRKKSSTGLVIGILAGVFLLCCGGGGGVAYLMYVRGKKVMTEAFENVQGAVELEQSRTNLQQIGFAIQAHANAVGTMPADSRGKQVKGGLQPAGRPLLSWRVHILPYLGEQALYRRFNLDEPWDSPNNRLLVAQMPAVYITPEAGKRAGPGKTYYRGFTSKGAAFEKPVDGAAEMKLRFPASFPDGLSNTLLVVEAGDAVEWTKPDDLDWPPGRPRPELGGIAPKLPFLNILMGDGSVRKLRRDVPDQTLRWLIDRQDGNVIPNDWEVR